MTRRAGKLGATVAGAAAILAALAHAPVGTANPPRCMAAPGAFDADLCAAAGGLSACVAHGVVVFPAGPVAGPPVVPAKATARTVEEDTSDTDAVAVASLEDDLPGGFAYRAAGGFAQCAAESFRVAPAADHHPGAPGHRAQGAAGVEYFNLTAGPGVTLLRLEAVDTELAVALSPDNVATPFAHCHQAEAEAMGTAEGRCFPNLQSSPPGASVRLNEAWGPLTPPGSDEIVFGTASAHVYVEAGPALLHIYVGFVQVSVRPFEAA